MFHFNVTRMELMVQLRGAEPFWQAGHIKRYNTLRAPEHSNISNRNEHRIEHYNKMPKFASLI